MQDKLSSMVGERTSFSHLFTIIRGSSWYSIIIILKMLSSTL